jgi:hypothetical protein
MATAGPREPGAAFGPVLPFGAPATPCADPGTHGGSTAGTGNPVRTAAPALPPSAAPPEEPCPRPPVARDARPERLRRPPLDGPVHDPVHDPDGHSGCHRHPAEAPRSVRQRRVARPSAPRTPHPARPRRRSGRGAVQLSRPELAEPGGSTGAYGTRPPGRPRRGRLTRPCARHHHPLPTGPAVGALAAASATGASRPAPAAVTRVDQPHTGHSPTPFPCPSFRTITGIPQKVIIVMRATDCRKPPRNTGVPFLNVTLRNAHAIEAHSFRRGGHYARAQAPFK